MIEPGGGLGNRILAMASAFALARDCGIDKIVLYWRNNNECGCDYEDIFVKMPKECIVKNIHFEKQTYKELLTKGKLIRVLKKYIQTRRYHRFVEKAQAVQLDTGENRTSREDYERLKQEVMGLDRDRAYIEAYYRFYGENDCSEISFNRDIVDKVENYKKSLGKYDAVHIRRTDNEDAIRKSPTELFYRKIEELVKENPSKKIYVATDDKAILDDLKSRYPSNVVSEATEAVSRRTAEGIRFAVYEMLILAGAEKIYASFGSTFTIIANSIGHNSIETLKTETE